MILLVIQDMGTVTWCTHSVFSFIKSLHHWIGSGRQLDNSFALQIRITFEWLTVLGSTIFLKYKKWSLSVDIQTWYKLCGLKEFSHRENWRLLGWCFHFLVNKQVNLTVVAVFQKLRVRKQWQQIFFWFNVR